MSFDDNILIPGPSESFRVDLSRLDACHPVHYSRRLLIFKCKSQAQRHAQLAALKVGIQRLLLQCPVLGGLVVPLAGEASNGEEDWRTIVPGRGLELIVRDLETKLPSFEELESAGFPSSKLPYDLLVPVPQGIGSDRPFAACKMQFSAINGGTILTFSMSHSVADGSGTNELMRILSEETKLAQQHVAVDTRPHEPPMHVSAGLIGLDRTVLRNMTSTLPFSIEDHPGFKQKPSHPHAPAREQVEAQSFKARSPEVPVLLHIPNASLAQLKADATLHDAPPISTHDALAALMWRSVLQIRSSRSSSSSKTAPALITADFFMPSDARRHLNLPPSYIGNVVYQLAAHIDLETLLSPSGLQYAASAIRRAILAVTPALVASYVTKMKETWVDWAFPETMLTTGLAMGTDWTSNDLYHQDWGMEFGSLVRYRYPDEAFNCIMPKLQDGSAELLLSVMPEEVELLKSKECFGKYIVSH
jgi:hypothetical protein